MNAINRLRAEIARKTDLDPHVLADDVIANFFDDKLDIIGDILKHKDDPMMIGKILIDLLDSTICDVVASEESLADDETQATRRADFDRAESRRVA